MPFSNREHEDEIALPSLLVSVEVAEDHRHREEFERWVPDFKARLEAISTQISGMVYPKRPPHQQGSK